ncbi:MauE/DoxX family redox-associated membrane protein [Croceibacter atlanticus]|uniref:MauE/DoxX family redox-associated membrane protein n=1 Tax=Croceibacter atlanticus TaxID=313588 RepID=UPI002491A2AC|nr:MauE/DoxX family redox-associated membrane protein [Croceibacter atlanticus]
MIHKKVPYHLAVKFISFLFIILFVYAATSKLLDFENFTVQLAQSPLLSAYAGIIAWSVPGLEILIAVLLVLPGFRKIGLYASFFLMELFTAYIFIILNYADFLPCSCGGVLEKLTWEQHLVFNSVFVLIVVGAILLDRSQNLKANSLLLCLLSVVGIGIVTLLFSFSEKKMHRNNAFIRRYPPHPIINKDTLDLKYNSYYFAGSTRDHIYLGNYTAPLQVLRASKDLKDTTFYRINLPIKNVPYTTPRIRIQDSVFILTDGSVPIIHGGDIKNWEIEETINTMGYFTFLEPISTTEFAIRTVSSLNENIILGRIDLYASNKTSLYPEILKGNMDGYFDRDGQLLMNEQLNKIIYVYYYKNEYEIVSTDFKSVKTHKTIDTVRIPQLDIKQQSSSKQKSLGSKTTIINGLSASYGKKLYINTDRLGRYEPKKALEYSSIIDVYNIQNGTYLFSFYLYRHTGDKLLSFKVYGNYIYALIGTKIHSFQIKDKYLNHEK